MPAIVEMVGEQGIDLVILDPDVDRSIRRYGVRHVSEAGVNEHIREDTGGWEHTAFTNLVFGRWPKMAEWPDETPTAQPATPTA